MPTDALVVPENRTSQKMVAWEATDSAAVKKLEDDLLLVMAIDYILKYGGKEFCILVAKIKSTSPPKGLRYADILADNPQFLETAKVCMSLDCPATDDEDITFLDTLISEEPSPDEIAGQTLAAQWINQLIENTPLSPLEREFLCKGFGVNGCDEVSFIELGKQHGITREAAYQTAIRAVRKLARILKRAGITADCF